MLALWQVHFQYIYFLLVFFFIIMNLIQLSYAEKLY